MTGRRTRKHAAAEPPVNVRLSYVNGDIVPVDCVYIGWDRRERMHIWQVINPRPDMPISGLTTDMLPAATGIAIEGSVIGDD